MTKISDILTVRNSLYGAVIYTVGDSIAALMTGDFLFTRMLGMICLGGSLYALEIPNYFKWLEKKFDRGKISDKIYRALLAQAFFNPLWIARHIFFIDCFSAKFSLSWNLLRIGVESFVSILPFALAANFVMQNHVPLRWRFIASALFSSFMAFYYALSEVLFG